MIYLDTSALCPIYWAEPLSRAAQRVLARASSIAISDLAEVELFSAIARRLRRSEITRQTADLIADEFAEHLRRGVYRQLEVTRHDFRQAANLIRAFDTSLRALDAIQLAVAKRQTLQLVTADGALHSAALVARVDVLLLSDD